MFQTIKQKEQWHLVVAFLIGVSSLLSANAKVLADQGKLKPTDATLFVRSKVDGNNVQNLLQGKTSQEIGVTNFDGQILNSDRYFVISAVTINYGTGLVAALPSAINYTTALPAALKNANLVIMQDNEVIVKLPVTDINDAKSTDARYRVLDAFALLRDQKTITMNLEFPAGGDLGAGAGNAGFVEVQLKGFETYIKR